MVRRTVLTVPVVHIETATEDIENAILKFRGAERLCSGVPRIKALVLVGACACG